MPFSTVFEAYDSSQCNYPCFSEVLLTSAPHNIHSKPLAAAIPHNHCRSSEQWWEKWILSQWLSSILRKDTGQARRSNQQPPVLKSLALPTQLWGSAKILGYTHAAKFPVSHENSALLYEQPILFHCAQIQFLSKIKSYNLESKGERCRLEIRLHILCSLILIIIHKRVFLCCQH